MNFKDDAQSLAWLRQQQATVIRTATETQFDNVIYQSLIPVATTGNPFAQSIVFTSSEQAGEAGWINGNADDVPMADTKNAAAIKPISLAAIGYGYGWDEVNQAQLAGFNVTADKAIAAKRAYEEFVDGVAFEGNVEKGMLGLINQTSATVTIDTTATNFNTVSTDANKQAIIKAVATVVGNTGGRTPTANTLLIPKDVSLSWKSVFIGTNSGVTLYDYIAKNGGPRGGPIEVQVLTGLEDAGGGGSKHRLIAYNRNPTVLQLHIPMPHRFLPVYQAGPLRWEVPGVFRLAGLNVQRKNEVSYLDSTAA